MLIRMTWYGEKVQHTPMYIAPAVSVKEEGGDTRVELLVDKPWDISDC